MMSNENLPNSSKFQPGKWREEEVVISGMSGRFPKCENVKEFLDKLANKEDMLSSVKERWPTLEHPEVPPNFGMVDNLDKFDAGFFGVHYRQTEVLYPGLRRLYEVTIEAIMDAGIHPSELEGTRTGIFLGFSWNDSETTAFLKFDQTQSFAMTGLLKSMFANRISYFLKTSGPSLVVDTACSSSLIAIDHAYNAIKSGKCDKAIVASCQTNLHPCFTVQFFRFGVLSPDGQNKVFDQEANGYVRSEAVSCVLLEKSSDARRIYARIVNSRINTDGFKSTGLSFPSSEIQGQLLKEIYTESGIDPSQLSYIETHGTGTKVGDVEEIAAIDKVFGKKRKEPLWVGSVKSSIGHAEMASGLNSLIKVLLCMHSGYLLPNINFKNVKKEITGIYEGRFKVVTEKTRLEDENALIGISSFGFGGSNAHIIVEKFSRRKQQSTDNIPRLVCISARTEEGVRVLLKEVETRGMNIEYIGLLHHAFKKPFEHSYRGFSLISKNGLLKTSITTCAHKTVPFYVIFGHFQESYKRVKQYFLNFPVFEATMTKINKLLEGSIDNILDAAVVQLGVIDVLKALELVPELICHQALSLYFHDSSKLPEVLKLLRQKPTNLEQKSVPKTSIVLSFADDGTIANNPNHFLETLGHLYEANHNPQLTKLYPEIKFPVSPTTPFISPLIRWNRDRKWYVPIGNVSTVASNASISFSLKDEKYIEGHVIDGRNLFPATGYLYAVWKVFAKNYLNQEFNLSAVVFENCKFVRATMVPKSGHINFTVSIQKTSGYFEILESENIVVSGKVSSAKNMAKYRSNFMIKNFKQGVGVLEQQDIYKELHLRGYNYTGLFKNLVKCNTEATAGELKWDNNWVAFMDTMLQIKILQKDTRDLFVPTGIKKFIIDPIKHLEFVVKEEVLLPVVAPKEINLIKSGGIEIVGLQASPISKRKQTLEPVLEKHVFVPNETTLDLADIVRVNTQLIYEESLEEDFNAVEVLDEFTSTESLLMPLVFGALEDVPVVHPFLTISSKKPIEDIPGIKIEDYTLGTQSNLLLVIGSEILQRPKFLKIVLGSLAKNGFVLTREKIDFCLNDSEDITIITQYTTQEEKLVLFKKTQVVEKIYIEVTDDFSWIPLVQKNLKGNNVVLFSQNPMGGILGFMNCIRREPGGHKLSCIVTTDEAPKFDPKNPLYSKQIAKNLGINVYKNSQWGTYKHLKLEATLEGLKEHAFAVVGSRGDLSSLRWVEGNLSSDSDNPDLVYNYYCAINFKDIMTASGRIHLEGDRISQECVEGFEYSGKNRKGQRVMGLITNGALSTMITADSSLSWVVPDEWSLAEAATVPAVYSTVIYGLLMRTNFKPRTSILIHSATGGIGLAALNVAFFFGCEVFVTVGTKEKRKYLKEHFPQIPESHIGNSRNTSFVEMIKSGTNGRGVDYVLNSLAEEKLKASVECLAKGGQFIEIGKFDLMNNNSLDLLLLEKDASYHGIMLDQVFKQSKDIKMKLWHKVQEGLKAGYVKPLPTTIFKHEEIEAAFRYMMHGTHIGKVLVKVREETGDNTALIKARLRFSCDPTMCYIILGGLGGFGLELADWLVLRGARNLVLTSRKGIQNGYQMQRIKTWESYGASIKISTITITSKKDTIDLIEDAKKMGPIDGIFNLAVVLEDALFEDQTQEKFINSLTPKAFATKFLDEVSKDKCPHLRYFVVFSSVSCGRGNAGQTNYGMANSIMERICEKRKSEGLPALAIQWGAVGDVGLVAKMRKDNKELVIGGTLTQKISSCLSVLDQFLKQNHPIVSSMVVAEKRDRRTGSSASEAVATILGIKDLKTVSQQSTLAELGMDSMMGTELIQTLEKDFEIFITAKDIRNMTFAKFREMDAGKASDSGDQTSVKLIQGSNSLIQLIPKSTDDNSTIINLEKGSDGAPTIFIFPGIEGVFRLLEPFTKNLKARLLGVQYPYKDPQSSIRDIAKKCLPSIEKELKDKEYYLIGYSFGATVSLEVASLLEAKNRFGKIFLIDGSPHYTKELVLQYAPGETESEIETMLLYNIFATFLPIDVLTKTKDVLLKCNTFDERVDKALSLVPPDLANKKRMEKQAVVALHKRFQAVREYTFSGKKIKSMVKLYKAEFPMVRLMEEDYKLSQMCDNKVEIMNLKGDHSTILQQSALANDVNEIINGKL